MSAQQFRTAVESPEGTGATSFVEVPAEIVAALGGKKRPAVLVTLNGYIYRTTIAVYGGKFYLPVRREVREGATVIFGELIDIAIELDDAPRTVETPDDLAQVLRTDSAAQAAFDKLSYTHRKEYVDWITSAKRDETRRRRIEQAIEMLRAGTTPKGA